MYYEQLAALGGKLGDACGMTRDALRLATHGLLNVDLDMVDDVISGHGGIVAASSAAQKSAFSVLALHAPVAADLRTVVSSIQIAADIERMGGLAAHVAKIARRRFPEPAVPEQLNAHFAEMGADAAALAHGAAEALVSRDPSVAAEIRPQDEAINELHRHLLSSFREADARARRWWRRGWSDGIAAAVDVALLDRFYERFADHAVEIARRVVFQATGHCQPGERWAS
ncbi:Phosphate-specific transport system accessory protein PhoU [Mycobacterium talmoniae]|uniref:Phosphate-specific transport system accessory protein PhoU n=1 Tax=Mycobacterium talmoniae TaxID=1858794 RepID=A0A2S8BJ20_9MYCO|nr:Phosphate-specific transport system accessory protein PhoU [Mycobacterium talmoniae]